MSKKKTVKYISIILVLLIAVIWLMSPGGKKKDTPVTTAKKEAVEGKTKKKRKIKYWVAPMNPNYISSKPGKSPMGMDLVPVYEGENEEEGVVKIDPVTVQDIGVKTTEVRQGPLIATVRTVGQVTYNEKLVQHIHTKVSGWVEDLFVNTTGQEVSRGEERLSIYSPELVATQQEYLQALRYETQTSTSAFSDVASGGKALVDATRRRLLYMDIDPAQIEALEKRGTIQKAMILRSPTHGIVIDKKVLAGMKVTPGMELYTIADISNIWVMGSIYEYELPFIRTGQEAEITLPYEPGVVYKGRVSFIYPYLQAATRTVQIRMDFKNPGFRLKPDMYVNVAITTKVGENVLQVPDNAVIRTGTKNIVIIALGGGKFMPRDVVLGAEGQGVVEIKSGLTKGEKVVTSAQFLIDSESNLKEALNKMVEARKASGKKEAPKATPGEMKETGKEAPQARTPEDQKQIMSEVTDAYMKIHGALVAESPAGVKTYAESLADAAKKLKAQNTEGSVKDVVETVDQVLPGLLSGEIGEAKASFAVLSRAMVKYVQGPGRQEAHAQGVKIFYCPMKKESWLQTGSSVQNPFLDKDMLVCGNEIKY
ncbi:MAG: efflux RND transporter periplasmic adaptor subunit [Candidatus Sulfobium sp.]